MKPKKKYNFYTGKETKRIEKIGYKYLGKGRIGKIDSHLVDKEKVYHLTDFNGFGRYSPYTRDKSKFKKVVFWEEDFSSGKKRNMFENHDAILKQKPKDKIITMTKIGKQKGESFLLNNPKIRFTKEDYISFFHLSDSILIRELQLKEGDKLKITIEKK